MRHVWLIISILFLSSTGCKTHNPNPTICLIIGNSTIAKHEGLSTVASFMRVDPSINNNFYICDISRSGDKISQQRKKWLSLRGKKEIDIVMIQIGLNDLYPSKTTEDLIIEYQSLIDTIKCTGKEGVKVVAATMVPCKKFWLTKMGPEVGNACFDKWIGLNEAIMGLGSLPLQNLDYKIDEHTTILGKNYSLKPEYNSSDDIHENDAGRVVIAKEYAKALINIYNTHNNTIE